MKDLNALFEKVTDYYNKYGTDFDMQNATEKSEFYHLLYRSEYSAEIFNGMINALRAKNPDRIINP